MRKLIFLIHFIYTTGTLLKLRMLFLKLCSRICVMGNQFRLTFYVKRKKRFTSTGDAILGVDGTFSIKAYKLFMINERLPGNDNNYTYILSPKKKKKKKKKKGLLTSRLQTLK